MQPVLLLGEMVFSMFHLPLHSLPFLESQMDEMELERQKSNV
jgi:hypothetical protein